MTAKTTKHYKEEKSKNIDYTKWGVVLDVFVERVKKSISENLVLVETPDVYSIKEEKVNLNKIFESVLWDVFYSECPDYDEVTFENLPTKNYVRKL